MTLAVEVAGKTDIGCVRTNNEDNFGYDSRHGIFVLCNGMGGQAAGEVASKLAVDVLLRYFREHASAAAPVGELSIKRPAFNSKSLAHAIELANRTIYEAGHGQRSEEHTSELQSPVHL